MVSIERRSEKSFRLIVENGYDDNGKRDRKRNRLVSKIQKY